MMDKRIERVKEFVGGIVQKLPAPYAIEVKKKYFGATKTIILHFRCARNSKVTLQLQSTEWGKWIKFGFSLVKAAKCVITADAENLMAIAEDGIGSAKAAFVSLRRGDAGAAREAVSEVAASVRTMIY